MSNGDLLKIRYVMTKDFIDRNCWALVIYGGIAGFALLLFFGNLRNVRLKEERARKAQIYLVDHKCQRVGFAGKDAMPTYQCDNGLWLHAEITRLANPEWEP